VLILEAESEAIAAGVDIEREIAEHETVIAVVWAQFGGLHRLAVDGRGDAPMNVDGGLAGMEIESAGLCRRGSGKNDVIERIGAEAVLAVVEPEETRNAEPSGIGSELGFVIVAPLFDGLAISRRVCANNAGHEK